MIEWSFHFRARVFFQVCVCGSCAHCAQREMTHLMGPTECASAMVACTMPFLDNGLGANLAADYGCYSNEYWTSPYTAGGLSPMKQIEGELQQTRCTNIYNTLANAASFKGRSLERFLRVIGNFNIHI